MTLKDADQKHCSELTAFTKQFALNTLIKIKLRIFRILCLFSFRAPSHLGYQIFPAIHAYAALVREVKVDPLRSKVCQPSLARRQTLFSSTFQERND